MSHQQPTLLPATSRPGPTWLLGPDWDRVGVRQPGWLLLPLRGFLGVTFTVAALQKLANPGFFNATSPTSVQAQMHAVAPTSPIGPLVNLSLHAGWLVGLIIALAELAVGMGTILGLKSRLAATGGALLALTFFLTISWTTTPYYYGADIVFLFAWTPFIATGAAGVLSLDGMLTEHPMSERHVGPDGPTLERKTLLGVGAAWAILAGLTAAAGRLFTNPSPPAQAASRPGSQPATSTPTTHPTGSGAGHGQSAGMTPIAATTSLKVGDGHPFTDPATGNPAWLIRETPTTFTAFSAVCTHAGCTVDYDAAAHQFACPCHGGTYNATTGQVLGGPPPAPLSTIPTRTQGGTIYAE